MSGLWQVTVSAARGSAPRDAGARMLLWPGGQSGTIGGGALEFEASARARALKPGESRRWQVALGPALGQCCGGSVELLAEALSGDAPPVPEGGTGPAPLPIAVSRPAGPDHPLWLYGAGHVGRAVAEAAAAAGFDLTWIDFARARFPAHIPAGVTPLIAADPARLVRFAPEAAIHIVMTHSHRLDLDLCHAVLMRRHHGLHLIGSATKAARFRARLRALGHAEGTIGRLVCPLGVKALGKEPRAIALGLILTLTRPQDGGRIGTGWGPDEDRVA